MLISHSLEVLLVNRLWTDTGDESILKSCKCLDRVDLAALIAAFPPACITKRYMSIQHINPQRRNP